MKNKLLVFILMLIVPAILISCNKDDEKNDGEQQELSASELYNNAVQFVNNVFPGLEIMNAEVNGNEYEVTLDTDFTIDFNLQGQWIMIDCGTVGISPQTGIVPDGILTDLTSRHPEAIVTMIEKLSGGGYEIRVRGGTISGSLEMTYNANQQFVSYVN